jgi:hypothetical protein
MLHASWLSKAIDDAADIMDIIEAFRGQSGPQGASMP